MFFNVRAAKQLQPDEHLTIDGCPGLRLEASATRKTWTYRYKNHAGLMKQVAIGPYPSTSIQDASKTWETLRDVRADGKDPREWWRAQKKPAKVATAQVYTVSMLVQDYITGHLEPERKEAGALAARRALERLLEEEPEFAESPAAAVTRAMCFDILEARKATPTAAQKLRSMLGSAWIRALDAGKLGGDVPNWWPQVQKGRLKSKGKIIGGEHIGRMRRSLREPEIASLLAWVPENMNENAADATVMYLWTCARGSEFLAMRPEHVSEEKDGWWWTCPKALTKNAHVADAVDLRVPLVGRTLKIVKRRLKAVGSSGHLFEREGEQYTQHRYSTYIYDLQPYSAKRKRHGSDGAHLKALPVAGWTPHNLRRTGRTLLASIGCPEEIAEAILGHMPETIVGTYNAYTYDKERREWLTALAKHLEGVVQAGAPARP